MRGEIAPAFADYSEDEVHGFQEDEEAKALSGEAPVEVDSHIESFFGEEEKDTADEPDVPDIKTPTESELQDAEALSDAFFDIPDADEGAAVEIDKETALQGVNVETDADDDSDEEALPEFGGEIAPALLDSRDRSAFSEDALEDVAPEEKLSDEVTGRLDAFFTDSDEEGEMPGDSAPIPSVSADLALQGVDVESEDDEEDGEEEMPASSIAGPADESLFKDDTSSFEAEEAEEGEELAPAAFDTDFEALTEAPNGIDEDVEEGEGEIAGGDLFGDLEESIEQSFDDIITSPVEDVEIESALDESDNITDEIAGDETPVEAAFDNIADLQETESGEAEVAEQFDALFGEPELEEEPADEDVVFTLEDEGEEDALASSEQLEVAEDDIIEEIATEIEEDDILETLSEEGPPAVGLEEEGA